MCIVGVKLPRVLSRRGAITRAAPSWSLAATRQHPREFDTNITHTIMFDPDYNMMPPFFPQQPIFCSLKAISSVNREQPQSPLPCHHVISVASIGVASTPGHENARDSFCGRLSVWNRTTPDRRHLLPVATTKLIMRYVQSWISYAHCPFQWKWQVLHNYDISVLLQVGMFFDGIACLMKVCRWRDAPLVHARISNVTSQM